MKTIVSGGQILLHQIRMLKQVLKSAFLAAGAVLVLFLLYHMLSISPKHWESLFYNAYSELVQRVSPQEKTIEVDKDFWLWASKKKFQQNPKVSHQSLAFATKKKNEVLFRQLRDLLWQGKTLFLQTLALAFSSFFVTGIAFSRRKKLSGNKLSWPITIRMRLFLSRKASAIKLGKLPLVKGTETQHTLVSGGTGSGKTNCFHHILPQIRKAKQKAIVVDSTGVLEKIYFREGKDKLLAAGMDESLPWHPWAECSKTMDYESLAQSFVPPIASHGDSYWNIAAGVVLSSSLELLKNSCSVKELFDLLQTLPLKTVCAELAGTPAAAHMDINSERTSSSIRSVLGAYIGCLRYLKDTEEPFSIREWMKEEDDSWLFISCDMSERAALTPLVSAWTSVAIRSVLQMPTDINRRIWFVIDELPSLQKIKDLPLLLAEGRKFGACSLLSIQSPAQLEDIYGQNVSRVILGNCMTRIAFAEQDPEIAERISRIFGESEVEEKTESLSYGANEIRDGVSLSKNKRRTPVVSANDIQSLAKQQAFVRLAGNQGTTKVKFALKKLNI